MEGRIDDARPARPWGEHSGSIGFSESDPMDDAIAFKQLLQIRNLRVDGFSRQLAALRHRRDALAAELKMVERELSEAADRADAVSSTWQLRPGRLISGKQLHESLQETALARAEVARINERRQKMQREHQVEKKLVEKMEEALSSAIRVAQRTECVLEELGKMSKSVDELRTSLGID